MWIIWLNCCLHLLGTVMFRPKLWPIWDINGLEKGPRMGLIMIFMLPLGELSTWACSCGWPKWGHDKTPILGHAHSSPIFHMWHNFSAHLYFTWAPHTNFGWDEAFKRNRHTMSLTWSFWLQFLTVFDCIWLQIWTSYELFTRTVFLLLAQTIFRRRQSCNCTSD